MKFTHSLLLVLASSSLLAQKQIDTLNKQKNIKFNARETFAQDFYTYPANRLRTVQGVPGQDYWQNTADYTIKATLDTLTPSIHSEVIITYSNNSPENLPYVWLQTDQNLFKKNSRSVYTTASADTRRFAPLPSFEGGYVFYSVELIKGKTRIPLQYIESDTRMRINLPNPLPSKGGKLTLAIKYSFKIPNYGVDRLGIRSTKRGRIFEIAQ